MLLGGQLQAPASSAPTCVADTIRPYYTLISPTGHQCVEINRYKPGQSPFAATTSAHVAADSRLAGKHPLRVNWILRGRVQIGRSALGACP
jgi:hypothetical protein